MKGGNNADANVNKPARPLESVVLNQNLQVWPFCIYKIYISHIYD